MPIRKAENQNPEFEHLDAGFFSKARLKLKDTDRDGIPDRTDADDDSDGILDVNEKRGFFSRFLKPKKKRGMFATVKQSARKRK